MVREQRRLAAIVSVDVAGYSRLMGRDESGTLRALRGHRAELIDPSVRDNGGRIVKTTGDGLLLEFASVVDAVRCATVIQQGMPQRNADVAPDTRIELRIGINVGDVIWEADDIFGDGVNVAARLQEIAEPGGICLSDRVYHDVLGRVEATFVDGGPRSLKNIAEQVHIWMSGQPLPGATRQRERPADAASLASIAVLPFKVLSEDRQFELLADGLAEDVIALLARMPGFLVISRASSFAFRNRDASIPLISKQLDVRYIVEGSLRSVGDQVRVATQLTEASSGHVLWTGRFEAGRGAAFDLQDDIARGVITELEPELTRAEIQIIRRQRPENVDAWGSYRQAVGAIALKGWNEEAVREARQHLAGAIASDPQFALAYSYLAVLTALAISIGILPDEATVRDEALRAAERAIDLDDGGSEVLGFAGCAIADLGDKSRGIEVLRRAIELDPSNAQAHVALGASVAGNGDTEAGIETMRHGIRRSPRDSRLAFWGWALGGYLLRLDRAEEALQEAMLAARRDPKFHLARLLEAAALARLGRGDKAGIALGMARRLRPGLTLQEVQHTHGRRNTERLAPLWTTP